MTAQGRVRRRVVFVHGFDPRGPRHYEPLFQACARAWGAREGVEVRFPPRPKRSRDVASLAVETDAVALRVDMLRWDAVVRRSWPRRGRLALRFAGAAWRLVRSGSFATLWRRARPSALASVVLPAVHYGTRAAIITLAPPTLLAVALGGGLSWLALPALPLALALAARRLATPHDVAWIAAGIAHDARSETADPLGAQRARLARYLAAALGGDADETLVVAHSMGCRVAISLVADALRERPDLRVALLTLGHSATVLAGMAGARWFREDLRVVAAARVRWVDVSSPVDGANVALMDPVREALGPGHGGDHGGARTFSAWFRAIHSPARYAAARTDRNAMHFLFLAVPDRPDPRHLDLWDMLLRPEPALSRFARREEPGPFYAPEAQAARKAAQSRST